MKIEPSATMAISALLKEKKDKGEEVFDLGVGEVVGVKNQNILNAVFAKLADDSVWHYPPVPGFKRLREAAATWYNHDHQTNYDFSDVLVTTGGKFALYILMQLLIEPGDEVLLPKPFWVSYPEIIRMFNGVAKSVESSPNFNWKISVADLDRAWTSKAKILILNNVSNPAGAIYNRDELIKIIDWAKTKNILIISDEVYSNLIFDKSEFISCGAIANNDRVVVVQSCSKSFAMSGWRVGFVFGSKDLINQLSNIQSQSVTGVPAICQWAALAAIESRSDIEKQIFHEVGNRRRLLVSSLVKHFGISMSVAGVGLYLFVKLKDLGVENDNSFEFAKNLIMAKNVAVIPGAPFGAEGYIRLSYGSCENDICKGVEMMSRYIKNN